GFGLVAYCDFTRRMSVAGLGPRPYLGEPITLDPPVAGAHEHRGARGWVRTSRKKHARKSAECSDAGPSATSVGHSEQGRKEVIPDRAEKDAPPRPSCRVRPTRWRRSCGRHDLACRPPAIQCAHWVLR